MFTKKSSLFALILMLVLIPAKSLYAIGEITAGGTIGVTRDLNNLDSDAANYNTAMELYKEYAPDTQVSQIPPSYSFVWGFNFKYHFNFILFRLGSHFSRTMQSYRGSIKPASGDENVIKISSYQNSFPFSIAFIIPLKERAFFYMGAGMSYNVAYIKITQSDPSVTSGLFPDTNRRNRYTEDFAGYHFIIGAEAPVPFTKRFTISVEWIHQEGRSYPLSNGGLDENSNKINSPKRTINIEGDFILFGFNYYIPL